MQVAEGEGVLLPGGEIDAIHPLCIGVALGSIWADKVAGRDGAAIHAGGTVLDANVDIGDNAIPRERVEARQITAAAQVLLQQGGLNMTSFCETVALSVASLIGKFEASGGLAAVEARDEEAAKGEELVSNDGAAKSEAILVLVKASLVEAR